MCPSIFLLYSMPSQPSCSSRFCQTDATNVCRQKGYRFNTRSVIFGNVSRLTPENEQILLT